MGKQRRTTKMKYFIKEKEWEEIFKILKPLKGIHTRNERQIRQFMEAVWYVGRTGCQWRLLPTYYGYWRSVHRRFKKWSDKGIWLRLFERIQHEPDMEAAMIDATIVRAHACSAGYGKESQPQQALGRSRGGFSTKIHALVDALGNPLKFILSPGQRHEMSQAESLIQDISGVIVLGDKGYDSNAFIKSLENKECVPVIPSKRNRLQPRHYDAHTYKERHPIECFFGKIKHFRRVFSRFDKTAHVFLSFLHFVSTFI
jgi:transposase